ncbi:MAG: transglycosylase SLT domain-containing protein [Beijerinckiaceae bacterium]
MALFSLFTTPSPAAAPPPSGGVADAVRAGAERAGVDFNFLLRTASRESSLDPTAQAGTSTAMGLFQFIEQTWLRTVKLDGPKHGLQRYSDAISSDARGRYAVADKAMRTVILALRRNPEISAALAGELARRNGAALSEALGRQPSDGELYLAHVMGARGAVSLIKRAAVAPGERAASHFPEEAEANRTVFYARGGRARSLSEVRQKLTEGYSTESTAVAAAQPVLRAGGAWLSFFVQAAAQSKPARPVDSLFTTEGAQAPVSQAVARLWATPRGPSEPRANAVGSSDLLGAPQLARDQASPVSHAPRRSRPPGKPLDLQAFMKPVTT